MDNLKLKKLGMSKKEIIIYLKLLEYGESGVNNLARNVGENRTSVYSVLKAMQKKGFVSFYIKKNLNFFVPTDPGILIGQFVDSANSLKKLLPELLAVHNKYGKTKPKITFYEGVDGIKQIGELLLAVPGSTRLSFMGIDKNIHPEIEKYYEEDFINRRIEAGITYRGIVTGKLPMGSKHKPTEKGQLRSLKYIDSKKLPIKIHIDIFSENKVALYSYRKDNLMGVVIEHEDFFNTMKTVFELAWAGVGVVK
jgi:sugar-specific transcriptional regulator TrmB